MAAAKIPTDHSRTACKLTTAAITAATLTQPSRCHNKEGAQECSTDATSALVDVFMPRDDVLDTEDGKMDVTDCELEEFKCFYFMNKLATGERSKGCCESKPVRVYSEENMAVYCTL